MILLMRLTLTYLCIGLVFITLTFGHNANAQNSTTFPALCSNETANTAATINFNWLSCDFNNNSKAERWTEIGIEFYPDEFPITTYFSLIQIPGTYMGFQKISAAEEIVIFSVWCSKYNILTAAKSSTASSIEKEQSAKAEKCSQELKNSIPALHSKYTAKVFTNEGTGVQIKGSIKLSKKWYSAKMTLNHDTKMISASYREAKGNWTSLGTYKLPNDSKVLLANDRVSSFIEDWLEPGMKAHSAYYRNAYIIRGENPSSKTTCDRIKTSIVKTKCENNINRNEAKGAVYASCFQCDGKNNQDAGTTTYVVTGNTVLLGASKSTNIAPSACSMTCPNIPLNPITRAKSTGPQPSITDTPHNWSKDIDLAGDWSVTDVIVQSDWWQKRPRKITVTDTRTGKVLGSASFDTWEKHQSVCGQHGTKPCEHPKNPTSHLRVPITPESPRTRKISVSFEGILSPANKYVIIKDIRVLGRKL